MRVSGKILNRIKNIVDNPHILGYPLVPTCPCRVGSSLYISIIPRKEAFLGSSQSHMTGSTWVAMLHQESLPHAFVFFFLLRYKIFKDRLVFSTFYSSHQILSCCFLDQAKNWPVKYIKTFVEDWLTTQQPQEPMTNIHNHRSKNWFKHSFQSQQS